MNPANPVPPLLSQPKSSAGKIGLGLSLVAPTVIALMMLLHPGWGSPLTALGGLAILVTPPMAFIVSLLAWMRKANRSAAMAGVVISGTILLLYFGGMFVSALCR